MQNLSYREQPTRKLSYESQALKPADLDQEAPCEEIKSAVHSQIFRMGGLYNVNQMRLGP